MKPLQLVALALVAMAAAPVSAQQRSPAYGPRVDVPVQGGPFAWERGHGFRRGFPGFIIVEREVVIKEAPPPPSAVPLPQKSGGGEKAREPYVVGKSYASLPGGCMKMIEGGASYYYCGGGEWYRAVGKQYRAIARP